MNRCTFFFFFFALHFAVNMFSRCFAAVGHTLASARRCWAMSLRDCHDCRPTSEKSLGQFCYSNWSVVTAGNPCMHDVNDFTIEGLGCTKKRRKGLSVPKNQNAFSLFCAQINLTIISICHWFTAVCSGQSAFHAFYILRVREEWRRKVKTKQVVKVFQGTFFFSHCVFIPHFWAHFLVVDDEQLGGIKMPKIMHPLTEKANLAGADE